MYENLNQIPITERILNILNNMNNPGGAPPVRRKWATIPVGVSHPSFALDQSVRCASSYQDQTALRCLRQSWQALSHLTIINQAKQKWICAIGRLAQWTSHRRLCRTRIFTIKVKSNRNIYYICLRKCHLVWASSYSKCKKTKKVHRDFYVPFSL